MLKLIKKGAKLSEENRSLFWVELVMFSVIPGLFFHAWLLTVIMLPVLSWLITRPNGMFYMIFAISLIWALVPFCMGFAGGGWVGAFIAGGITFLMGVKVHINGLKWHWDEVIYRSDDVVEWKRMNWSGRNCSRSLI